MRINYNLLWVEDNKNWYSTTKELFEDLMNDLGFKLTSKNCKNFNEVNEEIQKNNLKPYDLLLVDFSLAGSKDGDEIINLIRSNEENPILTDILFYSTDVQSVKDSMSEFGLEGVYTSHRNEIERKFELVVNTTIKKIQEVNSMRGLIMSETSDLDDLMLNITQKLLSSEIRETMEKYIKEQIISTSNKNHSKTLCETTEIKDKIRDSRIFTTFHRAKCVNKLYKEKQVGVNNFFQSYDEDIISTRNIFAHVKEVSNEDGKSVLISHVTGREEVFNEERCIEIRKKLIHYRNILETINSDVDLMLEN
jgi:CheY-like chemotaxis protein